MKKPKMKLTILFLIFCSIFYANAQLKIGLAPTSIDARSILELESDSKALFLPRLTTIQRDAQIGWKAGMVIYNITLNCTQTFNGNSWNCLANSSEILPNVNIYNSDGILNGDRLVNMNGNNLFFNGGNVGFNLLKPISKIDVALGDSLGILLRGGDWPGGGDKSQLTFGYTWDSGLKSFYRHDIRTRHQPLDPSGNSIDFYIWTPGLDIYKRASKQVMTLNGYGNVGIGTTYPTATLDIVGSLRVQLLNQSTQTDYLLTANEEGFVRKRTVADFISSLPVASGDNFYTTNGTISNNRLVSLNGNNLVFNGGKIGVGALNPQTELHIEGTGAIVVPVGTTAEQPVTTIKGMVRFNTDTGKFEGFDGTSWTNFN